MRPNLFVLKIVLLLAFVAKQNDAGPRVKPHLCPRDFLKIQNKCYYFSSNAETWQDSHWKCAERNSSLAVILNKHQSDALRIFLSKGYLGPGRHGTTSSRKAAVHVRRWLGGQYDWKRMQWKWAANGKVVYHQEFVSNSTVDKASLKWHCLLIDPQLQYRWNSSSCLEKNYYICETKVQRTRPPKTNISIMPPRFNQSITPNLTDANIQHVSDSQPGYYVVDSNPPTPPPKKKKKKRKKFICPADFFVVRKKCYHFSQEKMTWQDAFYKCQERDSELAVLKNLRQDKRLRMSLKKYNISKEQRWLGGRYDWQNLSWKWAATGEVVQNQMHGSEHLRWACIIWDPKLLNKWTSDSCLATKHFVCQTNAKSLLKKVPPRRTFKPEVEFRVNNVVKKRIRY